MKSMTKAELTEELKRLEETRNTAAKFDNLALIHLISIEIRQIIVELDSRG